MILWRSCNASLSDIFDGTGGLLFAGRWHSQGQPITYSSNVPSLTLLERLVHVQDPDLLPPMAVMAYEAPDDIATDEIALGGLASDWREDIVLTRKLGDGWIKSARTALLRVPSAIVPLPDIPDRNIVINHQHPESHRIRISRVHRHFSFDARLFRRSGQTTS